MITSQQTLFRRVSIFSFAIFILFVPFNPFPISEWPIPLSPSDLALVASLISYLIFVCLSRNVSGDILADGFLFSIFCLSVVFSTMINSGGLSSPTPVRLPVKITCVYLLAFFHMCSIPNLRYLLRFYTYSAVIVSGIAISQSVLGLLLWMGRPAPARSLFGFQFPFTRSAGPFGTYGDFGMFLIFILPILLYTVYHPQLKSILASRDRDSAAVIIILFSLFLSQTRSIWLSAFISIGLLSLYRFCSTRSISKTTLMVSGGSLGSGALILIGILYRVNPDSALRRLRVYVAAGEVLLSNPMLGTGFGQFLEVAPSSIKTVVHNLFLEALVTVGFLGFIPLAWLCCRNLIRSVNYTHRNTGTTVPLVIGFVGALTISQVTPALWSAEFWMPLGILGGSLLLPE
ncbi:O-antigen ligase family protein [Halobacterium salinarum]|uniref:O-antigen ligase family protein n=1 Tax=Halobacterium salinarum TaxID=2242 RepID=UPI001F1AF0E6|nr:O-antigen ligase family protein [Halobacterium salinarum]MCF2238005.1 O-antigen ligase family protein [Halobacterium salinarum]